MQFLPPDINKPGLADIHCHILPGIDDGSRNLRESRRLLRFAYAQGFRTFVATPHYRRRHENADVEALTQELLTEARRHWPDIDIYPGQEGYWHEEFPERIRNGQARRLANSSYLLCEFDPVTEYREIARGLRGISEAGCIPVLAHLERYPALRQGAHLQELHDNGIILQMNYEALAGGGFFDAGERWCRKQLKQGLVDLLGTDMHRMDFRPPNTEAAQEWLRKNVSEAHMDILTRRNALHIIRNEETE